jgi:hypothetical protein
VIGHTDFAESPMGVHGPGLDEFENPVLQTQLFTHIAPYQGLIQNGQNQFLLQIEPVWTAYSLQGPVKGVIVPPLFDETGAILVLVTFVFGTIKSGAILSDSMLQSES